MSESPTEKLDLRKLDDGSWCASHPTLPVYAYGHTTDDATSAWLVLYMRYRRGVLDLEYGSENERDRLLDFST